MVLESCIEEAKADSSSVIFAFVCGVASFGVEFVDFVVFAVVSFCVFFVLVGSASTPQRQAQDRVQDKANFAKAHFATFALPLLSFVICMLCECVFTLIP